LLSRLEKEWMKYAWLDKGRRGAVEPEAAAQRIEDARDQLYGSGWREIPKDTDPWFVPEDAAVWDESSSSARPRRWPLAAMIAAGAAILVVTLLLSAR
jgi:hypothetical protein